MSDTASQGSRVVRFGDFEVDLAAAELRKAGRAVRLQEQPFRILPGYLAHVSAIDHEVGRVLDYLDQHRLAQDTIVVYSSDHGDMLGSHGRGGKRQPFEESIRIPFVVRWSGSIAAGSRPDIPIGVVDFLPTLVGLAGAPLPRDLDGRDLSGVLRGEAIDEPEYQPIMHLFQDLAGVPNHPAEIFRGEANTG